MRKLSKKICAKDAKSCTHRNEFIRKYSGSYAYAKKNGFLDEICKHMKLLVRKPWTIESILNVAKSCTSYRDFMHNNDSAFKSAMDRKIIPKIKKIFNQPIYSFEDKVRLSKKAALKYKYRNDFKKNDPRWHRFAYKNNLLHIICKHMPNRSEQKWTKKTIIELAKTCTDYKDFYDKYQKTAYYAARRKKLLKFIIKILGEPHSRPNFYYKGESKSRIILEALLGVSLKKTKNIYDLKTKLGNNLELDGYNEKHKIAFEYNGKHHYDPNHYIYKRRKSKNDWSLQQENDKIKKEYCKKHKIKLIIIPEHKNLKFNSLYNHIKTILDSMNIEYNKKVNIKSLKLQFNKIDSFSY